MTHTPLPCPFCGGNNLSVSKPTAKQTDPYDPSDRLYPAVRCLSFGCYAEVPGKDGDFTTKTAITAWNRRAPLDALERSQPEGATEMRDAAFLALATALLDHRLTREEGSAIRSALRAAPALSSQPDRTEEMSE